MTRRRSGGQESPPPPFPGRWLHEGFLAYASEPGNERGRHALGAFLTLRLADRLCDPEPPHPLGLQYQVKATREYLEDLDPQGPEAALMLDIVEASHEAFETSRTTRLWSSLVAFADWWEGHGWDDLADDVLGVALDVPRAGDHAAAYVLVRRARWNAALAERAGAEGGGPSVDHWLLPVGEIARQLAPREPRGSRRVKAALSTEPGGPGEREAALRRLADAFGADDAGARPCAALHLWLGDLLAADGRLRHSIHDYAAARELAGAPREHAEASLGLARSFRLLGRQKIARRLLARLLAAHPSPAIHLRAFAEAMDGTAACADRLTFQRLRRLIPERPDPFAETAWQDFQGRLAAAARAFGQPGKPPSSPPRGPPRGAA